MYLLQNDQLAIVTNIEKKKEITALPVETWSRPSSETAQEMKQLFTSGRR